MCGSFLYSFFSLWYRKSGEKDEREGGDMRGWKRRIVFIFVLAAVAFNVLFAVQETAFSALREHEKISGPSPPVPPRKPSMQDQQKKEAKPSTGNDGWEFPSKPLPEPEFKLPVEKKAPPKIEAKPKRETAQPENGQQAQSLTQPQKQIRQTVPPAAVPDGAVPLEKTDAALQAGSEKEAPKLHEAGGKLPMGGTLSFPVFFYFVLFAILGGAVYYIYRRLKDPAALDEAKQLSKSFVSIKKNMDRKEKDAAASSRPPSAGELGLQAKVKNKSLLEQLIKYDMETYGEIRADLSYDDPYWVEHLIRKYGKGDKSRINRAILSYHAKRNRK